MVMLLEVAVVGILPVIVIIHIYLIGIQHKINVGTYVGNKYEKSKKVNNSKSLKKKNPIGDKHLRCNIIDVHAWWPENKMNREQTEYTCGCIL